MRYQKVMAGAKVVAAEQKWRCEAPQLNRWLVLEATRGGQLIDMKGQQRPVGPLVHHTCAPLVTTNDAGLTEIWLCDGGIWRLALHGDSALALGTHFCPPPLLPLDYDRALALGAHLDEESERPTRAVAECGTAMVADASGNGLWTVATTPDGYYHLIHVDRSASVHLGPTLRDAWIALSAGGGYYAAVGFRETLSVHHQDGSLLCRTSTAALRAQAGLVDVMDRQRILALAMPRVPKSSPLAISFVDGVILWDPRLDAAIAIEGVHRGASLAFSDDDRELWLVEDGMQVARVDLDTARPRAEICLRLLKAPASGSHDAMIVSPPLISPCGRFALVELAQERARSLQERRVLSRAFAKNHTRDAHASTLWQLEKTQVLLDADRRSYTELSTWPTLDLSRCTWLAAP